MKKIFSIIFTFFLLFTFILVNVKADPDPIPDPEEGEEPQPDPVVIPTVTLTDGASIRTGGDIQGLRFQATLTNTVDVIERGFVMARGSHSRDDFRRAINNGSTMFWTGERIVYVPIERTDSIIGGTIYNMKERDYASDFSAIAYAKLRDGQYVYSETAVTRNISAIAREIKKDNINLYNASPLIQAAATTQKVTYNFNGGTLVEETQFDLDESDNQSHDVTDVVLMQRAYFQLRHEKMNKLYLKEINKNVYEIIKCEEAPNYNPPEDYTHFIGGLNDANNIVSLNILKALIALPDTVGKYIYFGGSYSLHTFLNPTVYVYDTLDEAMEIMYLQTGFRSDHPLPTLEKEYYTFAGWVNANNQQEEPYTTFVYDENNYDDVNLIAKFVPIQYQITYDFNGGTINPGYPTTYNYETEIILPTSSDITKEGSSFLGWYDTADFSGVRHTTIPVGTTGDKHYYARWSTEQITELDISDIDYEVISKYNPTKFVYLNIDSTSNYVLKNTNSSYYSGELAFGAQIFNNFATAIQSASDNDVIYVFPGTHTVGEAIATAQNLKVYGPNADIKATEIAKTTEAPRNEEANIQAQLSIKGSNFTLQGVRITDQKDGNNYIYSYISLDEAISNFTMKNTIMYSNGNKNGSNYHLISTSGQQIDGFYFEGNNLTIRSSETICKYYGIDLKIISNLVIKDSYFYVSQYYPDSNCAVLTHEQTGTVLIENNKFTMDSTAYVVHIGNTSNRSTKIDIIDNTFKKASKRIKCIKIYYADCIVDIIHNTFEGLNDNSNDTFYFSDQANTNTKYNIKYNKFIDTVINIYCDLESPYIDFVDNYYNLAPRDETNHPRPSYVPEQSQVTLEELEARYQQYLNGNN